MRAVVARDHRPWAQRIHVLLAELPAGATLAEVATGPGFLLVELGRLRPSARLLALDGAPPMLKIAQQEAQSAGLKLELLECDATRLRLDDASVDAAACKQLLNCIDGAAARRDVIREMARVVRPGGFVFVIDFDAGASLWTARAIELYMRWVAGPSFAKDFRAAWGRRMDRDAVEAWMREARLEVLPAERGGVSFLLAGRKPA